MLKALSTFLLQISCVFLVLVNGAAPETAPFESPTANTDIICSTENPSDCYPRLFQPSEVFQVIKEGQDIPPGLHVRMNIYTGTKEARLNVPMDDEDLTGKDGTVVEQAVVIVDQPGSGEHLEEPRSDTTKGQSPPSYNPAGKISPPMLSGESGEEFSNFQKAMLMVKMEARNFDKSLDNLLELSHDLYYGVEIIKDGPVLERLVCLTLGKGSERIPPEENDRGKKAAAILATALQNNPTALEELSTDLVMYPTCLSDLAQTGTDHASHPHNFVKGFRLRLGREKDPVALKAKVNAISSLMRNRQIRHEFLKASSMELLLAIFLKKGEQFDTVRQKVGQLITDNFLDESMGAESKVWPTTPALDGRTCQSKAQMLKDGCWEHHIGEYIKRSGEATWAPELLSQLHTQRPKLKDSAKLREL